MQNNSTFIDLLVDATLRISRDGVITFISPKGAEFLGPRFSKDTNISELLVSHQFSAAELVAEFFKKDSIVIECKIGLSSNLTDVQVITAKMKAMDQVVLFIRDISYWKTAEKSLEHANRHDALSGLPNRLAIYDYIQELKENKTEFSLAIIDIDRFQRVNELYGYDVGDAVLREVAARLSAINSLKVFKYGEDAFAVTVNTDNESIAMSVVSEILESLSELYYVIVGAPISITASAGVAMYDNQSLDDLLNHCSAALLAAQSLGKGQIALYANHLTNARCNDLEKEIQTGVTNGEFYLVYQPQFKPDGTTMYGAESLMRWKSSKFGFVSPAEFIPIAEKTGLIEFLGTWALRMSCYFLKAMNEECPKFKVSVNVSSYQLQSGNFLDVLNEAVTVTKINPANLNLEITESLLMTDPEGVQKLLEEINKLGVAVSIDDFGTGYSSLSYLSKFSLSALKVDKSFIDHVETSKQDRTIAKAIVGLAHDLSLYSVAEGVENTEQLKFIVGLGCEIIQGYLFSKPITGEEILENVKSKKWVGVQ